MFSIIIPVYNTPSEQLKASINSCINQTYSDIEIIIINDGSNQECLDILKTYAAKDKRIILINGDNGGVSKTSSMTSMMILNSANVTHLIKALRTLRTI